MLTTVPFSGFYYSLHDSELDSALEQMFSDRDSGTRVNRGLHERAYFSIDWQMVHAKYAAAYVDAFADEFGIALKFESLQSPREYNFTTDRIFAEVSEDEVRRLLLDVDLGDFTAAAKAEFTSRSGFHSFYDPDWRTWGDVLEWDHNQVGALLIAVAGPDFDQYAELNLMEFARDNGRFDEWLYDCGPKVHRLMGVRDYLEQRASRAA